MPPESTIDVIEPGATAFLKLPGADAVPVLVTGVTVRPSRRVLYEITYFQGGTRTCVVAEECELNRADAPKLAIGFGGAPTTSPVIFYHDDKSHIPPSVPCGGFPNGRPDPLTPTP